MEAGGEFADIDCLPFDCLVCICEYLGPRGLCRFGAVCRVSVYLAGRKLELA